MLSSISRLETSRTLCKLELLTSYDYWPGLTGGAEFVQGCPAAHGISLHWWGCLGQDFSVGCCLETCWQAGNSEKSERDGGEVWYKESRWQDGKKKEVKLNSPRQLNDVILLHLEAIGVTGSKQICLSTWTFTAQSASQVKPGKRGMCFPHLCLPNLTLEGLQAAVFPKLVKDIFTTCFIPHCFLWALEAWW